ncbi:MAG TPA: hypothetical protein VK498_08080 [Ferruginibacter sp.]|nr:hypothetical protein [Ferruginibacter sp.]
MKLNVQKLSFQKVSLFLMAVFMFAFAMAQDSTSTTSSSTTSVTTEQTTWYTQPWAWVVGGVIFILIIVALVRGNSGDKTGRTDKVTVTKSVKTDTDI